MGCGANIIVRENLSIRLAGSEDFIGSIHRPPLGSKMTPKFHCLSEAFKKINEVFRANQIANGVSEFDTTDAIIVINDKMNPTSELIRYRVSDFRAPQPKRAIAPNYVGPGSAVRFAGTQNSVTTYPMHRPSAPAAP